MQERKKTILLEWTRLIERIWKNGKSVRIRGLEYLELLNVRFSIPPVEYEPKLISHPNVLKKEIIPKILKAGERIKLDKGSRQAFIYFPELEKGELPCTITYLFFLRQNKKLKWELLMTVYMRSFDIINKFGSDVNMALFCQDALRFDLENHFLHLIKKGKITFLISSCHLKKSDTLESVLQANKE